MAANSLLSTISSIFQTPYPLVSVQSSVDGRTYRVRDLPDRQEAANLLARVRQRIATLYDKITAKYPDKHQIKRIRKNFRPDDASRFLEATPDAQHTSYSVNKGEQVHLCLRQRVGADESLVQENVMTFVALHELAHCATDTIGHGPDFWNNFGWLLKEAEANGIYQYTDFRAHPVAYCGMHITDSPAYDPKKDGGNLQIGKMN
jgi:predicted metal-dependent hydrolase